MKSVSQIATSVPLGHIRKKQIQARRCATHPNVNDYFVCGGRYGVVELYTTNGFEKIITFSNHHGKYWQETITDLCFSEDGAKLAVNSADGRLDVYNVEYGTLLDQIYTKNLHITEDRHLEWKYDSLLYVHNGGTDIYSFYQSARAKLRLGMTINALDYVPAIDYKLAVKAATIVNPFWRLSHYPNTQLVALKDGTCRLVDTQPYTMMSFPKTFRTNSVANSIQITPGQFERSCSSYIPSGFVVAGKSTVTTFNMTKYSSGCYKPFDYTSSLRFPNVEFTKCLFSRTGVKIYASTNDGFLYNFGFKNGQLKYEDMCRIHGNDIIDMALTCNEDYLIATSSDGTAMTKLMEVPYYYGSVGTLQMT